MARRPRRSEDIRFGRILKARGDIPVRSLGVERHGGPDIYHQLIRLSWPRLILVFVVVFLSFNAIFAGLYSLDPDGIVIEQGSRGSSRFLELFFFSVHSLATIGYGNMVPVTLYTNLLVVVEITLGIMLFALVTGIAFARFSRPTARILFSQAAVVQDVDGVPTLMFRAANQRHNLIFEAQVRVSLLTDDQVGGRPMRRFRDLALVRSANPVFALSWTVMHPIDADSPLYPWLEMRSAPADDELVVVLSGTDNHSGQTIHGRWAYSAGDVQWNHRFVDIIGADPDGGRIIDYTHFHDTEPVAEV
jgi:inward rectifier potassium channel